MNHTVNTNDATRQRGDYIPVVFDVETYPNYFLLGWRIASRQGEGEPVALLHGQAEGVIEGVEGAIKFIRYIAQRPQYLLVGFNSRKFDLPLINAMHQYHAARGQVNPAIAADIAGRLIHDGGLWTRYYPYSVPSHCDLLALCPPFISLKDMEARLHLQRLQSLPVKAGSVLSDDEMRQVKEYLVEGDLPATEALFHALAEPFQARLDSGNPKFLHLTDAQIAEDMLKGKVSYTLPERRQYAGAYRFPDTQQRGRVVSAAGQQALRFMENAATGEGQTGAPDKDFLSFGSGGLHSREKDSYFAADEEWGIVDADVTSYYPSMIINYNTLAGGTEYYAGVRDKRIALKKAGDPAQAMYKIVLNGTFGKMKSKYSFLYREGALESVTKTGQILLAELYGRIKEAGENGSALKVLSVNTDGITVAYRHSAKAALWSIFQQWQNNFGLGLEFQPIAKLLHKDVNNYWAIIPPAADGGVCKVKGKGVAVPAGLRSAPNCDIAAMAVERFLLDGTPIMQTIACGRLQDFVIYRKSTKGDIYTAEGECIGSNVRYIYGLPNSPLTTSLRTRRGQIARGGNVIPVNNYGDLPDNINAYIDYSRVITQSQAYLKGYYESHR